MTRHECARCGRHQTVETMVFSQWTRKRYCSDLKACGKRAARRDQKTRKEVLA